MSFKATKLPLLDRSTLFQDMLGAHGIAAPRRGRVTTLQLNVGKLCNQACHHCHVDAGPKRSEVMTDGVARRVVELLECNPSVEVLDITGGAPELNPNFRWLVRRARALGREVVDRCNLTILLEPQQFDLAGFLAEQGVHVIASMPCYQPANVDAQRGRGVFDKSIEALRRLNALGYGVPSSDLTLDLVYNPLGAALPPDQRLLEAEYKEQLAHGFGLAFNSLLTITNMPIMRFARALEREGKYAEYMSLLVNHFNRATLPGLMCRSLLSVGWDGRLYDCDFNQMLELPLGTGHASLWNLWSFDDLEGGRVTTGDHCFGCTAGAGSSCTGALQ